MSVNFSCMNSLRGHPCSLPTPGFLQCPLLIEILTPLLLVEGYRNFQGSDVVGFDPARF